jgi:hypothetical protein
LLRNETREIDLSIQKESAGERRLPVTATPEIRPLTSGMVLIRPAPFVWSGNFCFGGRCCAVTEEIAADRPAAVLIWLERARAISSRITPVRPPAAAPAYALAKALQAAAEPIPFACFGAGR